MKKIVYSSNTDHAYRYASMISEELNIPLINIKEIKKLSKNDEVIFISWVFASKIVNLKKVIKKFNVILVIAVGMTKVSEDYTNFLMKSNNILKPLFYLQGGVDYTKLKGFKKVMLKMVGKSMEKENKKENVDMIKVFKEGGDFVNRDNLIDVIEYLK